MSYAPKSKVQKVMVLPINLIFRYLQSRARVQPRQKDVLLRNEIRKTIGRILLKGDNITLIQNTQPDGTNM
nr:probable small nuclear ribonucleoprotein E [Cherax quadricarinatus]